MPLNQQIGFNIAAARPSALGPSALGPSASTTTTKASHSILSSRLSSQQPPRSARSGTASRSARSGTASKVVKGYNETDIQAATFENKQVGNFIMELLTNQKEEGFDENAIVNMIETNGDIMSKLLITNKNGITPLMVLMRFGKAEVIYTMLQSGLYSSLPIKDKNDNNVLHHAFQNPENLYYAFVFKNILYPQNGLLGLLQEPNAKGQIPLMYLLKYNSSSMVIKHIIKTFYLTIETEWNRDEKKHVYKWGKLNYTADRDNTSFFALLENKVLSLEEITQIMRLLIQWDLNAITNTTSSNNQTVLMKTVEYILWRRTQPKEASLSPSQSNGEANVPVPKQPSAPEKELEFLKTVLAVSTPQLFHKDAANKTVFHYLVENFKHLKDVAETVFGKDGLINQDFRTNMKQLRAEDAEFDKNIPGSLKNITGGRRRARGSNGSGSGSKSRVSSGRGNDRGQGRGKGQGRAGVHAKK